MHLKYAIQWFLVYLQSWQPSPWSNFRTLFVFKKIILALVWRMDCRGAKVERTRSVRRWLLSRWEVSKVSKESLPSFTSSVHHVLTTCGGPVVCEVLFELPGLQWWMRQTWSLPYGACSCGTVHGKFIPLGASPPAMVCHLKNGDEEIEPTESQHKEPSLLHLHPQWKSPLGRQPTLLPRGWPCGDTDSVSMHGLGRCGGEQAGGKVKDPFPFL